jgi:hypothetical protein
VAVEIQDGGPQAVVGPVWRNADVDWNRFDPDWYGDHNYRRLRDDDCQIIELVRDFFAGCAPAGGHGIDVGAGPNLYPAMAMLPFCDRIELRDVSERNVAWLRQALTGYDASWDPFWAVYRDHPAYRTVTDPRTRLAQLCQVRRASLFDLPPCAWDLGTMFFVACSISTDRVEFQTSLDCFTAALRPGAPFAVAVMERSVGYDVHGAHYPAVWLEDADLRRALAATAHGVTVHRVVGEVPLRDGYGGAMLLATGHAGAGSVGRRSG